MASGPSRLGGESCTLASSVRDAVVGSDPRGRSTVASFITSPLEGRASAVAVVTVGAAALATSASAGSEGQVEREVVTLVVMV